MACELRLLSDDLLVRPFKDEVGLNYSSQLCWSADLLTLASRPDMMAMA
jgi:hypothetical protein